MANSLPFQYLKRADTFEDLKGPMRTQIVEARDRDLEDFLGTLYDLANRPAAVIPNEVIISATDPIASYPEAELWYQTSPAQLYARVGGVWVPVGIDQATADARYVNVSGDTMAGQLNVADPYILTFNGPAGLRQMINLWSTTYGIGVQSNVTYFRSPNSFAFYIGGSHSDTKFDAGGGLRGPIFDNQGWLLVGKTAGGAPGVVGAEIQNNGVVVSTVNGAGLVNNWQSKLGASNVAGEVFTRFSAAVTPITAGEIKLAAGPTVTYGTTSDRRLKTLLGPVADPVGRLHRLQPRHFAWKGSGVEQDGFVADEVAEVVPDAVSGERDALDDDGHVVPQQLDQTRLVPLLTAALQEALDRIEILEHRVQQLEAA